MPDGMTASLHATITNPPGVNDAQLAGDMAFIRDLIGKTPFAYRLMAAAIGNIDGLTPRKAADHRRYDLEEALNAEALTLSVENLDDAVAVLSITCSEIERLEDFDLAPEFHNASMRTIRKAIESSLPFLAEASCLSLGALRCDAFAEADRERLATATNRMHVRKGAGA